MKEALRRAAKNDDDQLFAEFMGVDALDSILQEDVDRKAAEQREADIEAALAGPAPGASLASLTSNPFQSDLSVVAPNIGSVSIASVPSPTKADDLDKELGLFTDTKDLLAGAPPRITVQDA